MMAIDLDLLTGALQRRQLTTPILLFLAGHRPLAFFAGQMLHLAAPLALLGGWEGVNRWAEVLSAPDPLHHARLIQHDAIDPGRAMSVDSAMSVDRDTD